MTQQEPNYISSDRPANLRTAGSLPLARRAPENLAAQSRIAAAQARARLGRPLEEQVNAGAAATSPRITAGAVAGAVLASGSAAGVVIGSVQGATAFAAVGAAGVLAGALVAWRSLRRASPADAGHALPPLFDQASLQALDRVLVEAAPELTDAEVSRLADFNRAVVRIANHGASHVDGEFTMDDRWFVAECVRRYLPDSLHAYLAVPRGQRTVKVLEDGLSAEDLLASQLDMLIAGMEEREAKLAKGVAGMLLQQQRFLRSKNLP